eukprot:scaffold21993_cov82-Cylindrotheca_fusiformis.AAC.3
MRNSGRVVAMSYDTGFHVLFVPVTFARDSVKFELVHARSLVRKHWRSEKSCNNTAPLRPQQWGKTYTERIECMIALTFLTSCQWREASVTILIETPKRYKNPEVHPPSGQVKGFERLPGTSLPKSHVETIEENVVDNCDI